MRQIIKLTESDLHRIIKESVNKILREVINSNKAINEDGATNCASVMQTGCGNAPEGTNPEAGQYTVPFGPDKETSDRTPGFSVKGKAVGKSDVQRRQIYNPKSGK